MKVGEIKLEALRIMNINNDAELTLENFDSIKTEARYSKYINNMTNSINRAIDYINHRKVLPIQRMPLSSMVKSKGMNTNKYPLQQIGDLISIDKVVYEDEYQYIESVPYNMEGSDLVIKKRYDDNYLTLLYNPKMQLLDAYVDDDDTIIGMDDKFARIIPYFIKFDLYQEDEPDLALNAKATFEQELESLRIIETRQDDFTIEKVFSNGW